MDPNPVALPTIPSPAPNSHVMTFASLMSLLDHLHTGAINHLDGRSSQRHYASLLKRSPLPPVHLSAAERATYRRKWDRFNTRYTLRDFELFSRYIGKDPNIVPECLSHACIEPVLNPVEYRAYYEDKNTYDRIFPPGTAPETVLRCLNGMIYDRHYRPIPALTDDSLLERCAKHEGVIVKPTVDSGSGRGVLLFRRRNTGFVHSGNGNISLSVGFLRENCGTNFIIQQQLRQSPYLAQFNASSVNTLRLLVYRSVVDETIHVINAVLRVGKKGSHLDNAHAGGVFLGIDPEGRLTRFCCNEFGEVCDRVNDVRLDQHELRIPDFSEIKRYVSETFRHVLHHRCLSVDLAIDSQHRPVVIEFNLRSLSTWLWQFTSSACFGDFTDEIIDHCVAHRSEARKVYSIRN